MVGASYVVSPHLRNRTAALSATRLNSYYSS
jgi:hypothetical protein